MSSIPGATTSASPSFLAQRILQLQHRQPEENLSASACEINVNDTASLYPNAKARARKAASMAAFGDSTTAPL